MPPALTSCSMSSAMISTRPTAGPTIALIACVAATNVQEINIMKVSIATGCAEWTPRAKRTTQYRMVAWNKAITAAGR